MVSQPIRAAGRGIIPSGIPATPLASLVRSLLHAFEGDSLRESNRGGFQRTRNRVVIWSWFLKRAGQVGYAVDLGGDLGANWYKGGTNRSLVCTEEALRHG